jgi:hypothetical protein
LHSTSAHPTPAYEPLPSSYNDDERNNSSSDHGSYNNDNNNYDYNGNIVPNIDSGSGRISSNAEDRNAGHSQGEIDGNGKGNNWDSKGIGGKETEFDALTSEVVKAIHGNKEVKSIESNNDFNRIETRRDRRYNGEEDSTYTNQNVEIDIMDRSFAADILLSYATQTYDTNHSETVSSTTLVSTYDLDDDSGKDMEIEDGGSEGSLSVIVTRDRLSRQAGTGTGPEEDTEFGKKRKSSYPGTREFISKKKPKSDDER